MYFKLLPPLTHSHQSVYQSVYMAASCSPYSPGIPRCEVPVIARQASTNVRSWFPISDPVCGRNLCTGDLVPMNTELLTAVGNSRGRERFGSFYVINVPIVSERDPNLPILVVLEVW